MSIKVRKTVAFGLTEMSGTATAAATKLNQGQKKDVRKVRHFKKFTKPVTVGTPKKPLYEKSAVKPVSLKINEYRVIRAPVRSDKVDRKLDEDNTMTFWVDLKATKKQIASAFNTLYKIKPVSVNTLITAKCMKKAYIRLPKDVDAQNIATEAGFA